MVPQAQCCLCLLSAAKVSPCDTTLSSTTSSRSVYKRKTSEGSNSQQRMLTSLKASSKLSMNWELRYSVRE